MVEVEGWAVLEAVSCAVPVAMPLPLPETDEVGESEAVGVVLAAASLYSVPPWSATRISLLLLKEGEPRTGCARGTDHRWLPALVNDSRLPVASPTLVPTTSSLKQLKCAGVDSVKASVVLFKLKAHCSSPLLAFTTRNVRPTGKATSAVPTIVMALLGSQAPMPSTVGLARGGDPRAELHTLPPASSKARSTPSDVPLGEATTTMLVPGGFSPRLVPGMASTAVVVGAGRGTDHRSAPEAMFRDMRELSVAAYTQAPEAPRRVAPERMAAPPEYVHAGCVLPDEKYRTLPPMSARRTLLGNMCTGEERAPAPAGYVSPGTSEPLTMKRVEVALLGAAV